MLPPVHPGVAYLVYAGYVRLVDAGPPTAGATLAVVLGGALPDLIDQPLYHLGLAATTRTVGHAPVVGLALLVLGWLLVRRTFVDRRAWVAFAVGLGSHLVADAVWPLLLGLPAELRYLGWPLWRQPPYEGIKPLVAVGEVTITTAWVEAVILAAALAAWWRDGRPGLAV